MEKEIRLDKNVKYSIEVTKTIPSFLNRSCRDIVNLYRNNNKIYQYDVDDESLVIINQLLQERSKRIALLNIKNQHSPIQMICDDILHERHIIIEDIKWPEKYYTNRGSKKNWKPTRRLRFL